jgi:hypothetical protein
MAQHACVIVEKTKNMGGPSSLALHIWAWFYFLIYFKREDDLLSTYFFLKKKMQMSRRLLLQIPI